MGEREIGREIADAIWDRLLEDPTFQEVLADLTPRTARYRYWDTPDGYQFHYTVEPLADGKYASAVYVPKGKGSRSGNPDRLEVRREVHHRTRRAAKARAYKLWEQHRKDLAR